MPIWRASVPYEVLPSCATVICAKSGRSVRARTARSAQASSCRSEKVSRTKPSTPPSSSPSTWRPNSSSASPIGGGSPRLDAHPERADGARDVGAAPRRLAGEPDRRAVDLLGAGVEAVGGQLDRVGAEGVRLEDLGAGGHVLLVDLPHQLRAGHAQLVVADVHEDAAPVEQRAHRAVEDVDAPVLQQRPHASPPGLVAEVGGQPALRLRERHPLAARVVLHLVAAEAADAEVARRGMREVPPAHGGRADPWRSSP